MFTKPTLGSPRGRGRGGLGTPRGDEQPCARLSQCPVPCASFLHQLSPCVPPCQDPPDMLQCLGQPFSAFILMAGEIRTIFPAPITLVLGHGNISIGTQQPHLLTKLRKATKCPSSV